MSYEEIKAMIMQIATESASRGPGWAQEGVVLRTVGDRLSGERNGRPELEVQQAILNAWHDLVDGEEARLGI